MRRFNYLLTGISLAFVVLFGVLRAHAQTNTPMSSDISFTVAMSKPHTHLLEVEIRVKVAANLLTPRTLARTRTVARSSGPKSIKIPGG